MRPLFHTFAIIALLFATQGHAQKFEPGKVSLAELEQKKYPADTTAAAAILYNKAKSHFVYRDKEGFSLVHEYEFRIKIYKKEGLKWADFKVPYYVGYELLGKDRVTFSDAVTYNLENGQIVKTKLSGEGRFKSDVNEYWAEAALTMPNVKVGSVIEFTYTLKSDQISVFPEFHIQYDIPVAYSEYVTEIPQFFIYKPLRIGFGEVVTDSKLTTGYQNFANQYNQTVNLNFQQINTSYIARNVPALQTEPYVDNIENYRLGIEHELEKTVFPDAPEKNYAATWEGVALTIYKDKDFGGELNQRNYFEAQLEPVLAQKQTAAEKALAIFDFVKHSMHWNGNYGYYTRKGVKKAFAEGSGNIAEINLMLIAMLNRSGLNAYPVLVSTVDHGIPVFPGRAVFNYVVGAVEIDGAEVLLDATDKNTAPDKLPMRALNWTGRLIKKDGSSKEINLVPETVSRETVNILAKLNADGTVSGKFRSQKTDYEALGLREKLADQSPEQYVQKLEEQYGGMHITNYVSENTADTSKPVSETFNFVSDQEMENISGQFYINPLLFFTLEKNPFVLQERHFPVYYGYPRQIKYNISIEIPEGYAVESLPKSLKLTTGENVANFTFNILSNENKSQVSATQEVNQAIIPGSFYESLKAFYKNMIDKQNEKIILKKL